MNDGFEPDRTEIAPAKGEAELRKFNTLIDGNPYGHNSSISSPDSLKSASDGMKETQVRYFDSFDKGTEFYQDALNKAQGPEEREKILKAFSEHEKRGAKTAKNNNFSWYHYGLFGVAVVALAIGGPVAAAQVIKRI